jgi:hypothetical protein
MRGQWGLLALFCVALWACDLGDDTPITHGPAAVEAPSSSVDVSAATGLAPLAVRPVAPPAPAPPLSPRRAAFLAADVARLTTLARAAPEHPTRIVTAADTFVVAGGDPGAPVDAVVSLTERLVNALYTQGFRHRADEAALLMVYSSAAPFQRALLSLPRADDEAPLDLNSFGMYDERRHLILVRTDTAGIYSGTHEVVHHLMGDGDFPKAPEWISEGIPSLFEAWDQSPTGQLRFKAHFRLQTLRDLLASTNYDLSSEVTLEAAFSWLDERFEEGPRAYLRLAVAREALRFMAQRGVLWSFYGECRDDILAHYDCEPAFVHAFGREPRAVTAEWREWINSREAEGTGP